MKSNLERSMKKLKGAGFLVQKVETFNAYAGVRKDLYGFVDILAIHPHYGTVAVQVCGGSSDFKAHCRKIEGERREAVILWLLCAGNRLFLQGHRKLKGGWACTTKEYTLSDFPEITPEVIKEVSAEPPNRPDWIPTWDQKTTE